MTAMDDAALTADYEKKKALLQEQGHLSKKRLDDVWHQRTGGRYIGDVIFGANDGIITTFAVVSGATGGQLEAAVVIILGLANLFADGVSMGLGNFLGQRSEQAYAQGQREKEAWEIEHLSEVEKKEIREIFSRWGFKGADLERAVAVVTSNKQTWIDIMMKHELEIFESSRQKPARKGVATFLAFIIAGIVPLAPFLFGLAAAFWWAIGLTALELFSIGALRSKLTPASWFGAGLEMLGVGALAAVVAYGVGALVRGLV